MMELPHGPGLANTAIACITMAARHHSEHFAHAGMLGWGTWAPLKLPPRWQRGRCCASSLPSRNSIGTVCQRGSECRFNCKEASCDGRLIEANGFA